MTTLHEPSTAPGTAEGVPPDDRDVVRGDPECSYKAVTAKVAPPADPDASIDVACFMSTDAVDADDEVLLPGGVDLSRFERNPVVMLCHAYGQPGCYYPLPVGKVVWTRRRPHGVLAGVRFTDRTPMGREVKALFDDDVLRSFSVGFRPVEASPMTRDEAESRPDWKAAFERTRGRVNVHRRWQLIELSVAPVPSNPEALVTRYEAKGIAVPSWLQVGPPPEARATPTAAEAPARVLPDDGGPALTPPAPAPGDGSKSLADDPAPGPDEPGGEGGPIQVHDHVEVDAPHYRGLGRVEGLHDCGLVPDVDEPVRGTPDHPAARVRCYQRKGGGYVPTEVYVGVRLAHLVRVDPPSAPTEAAPVARRAAVADDEPLPPLVARSEAEAREEILTRLSALLSPDGIREIAREEFERAAGFI